MALTSEALRRSAGARGRALDGLVRDLLQVIDDRLRRAARAWGRNCVSHELPDLLPVPGMARLEAQTVVYSRVVRDLERRGFETAFVAEGGRCVLHVAWTAEPTGVEAFGAFLRARQIPAAAVPGFVRGGGAPKKGAAPGGGAPPRGGAEKGARG